jgi:hypothetical protein
MDIIVPELMNFSNQVKLYHWKTKSYARHKATCKFLELFNENVDRIVETFMGARDTRVNDKFTLKFKSLDEKNVVEYVKNFRDFLQKEFNKHVEKSDTDLLNIRDEILADVNRMLYLFTLK